jgi:hypothetical protein
MRKRFNIIKAIAHFLVTGFESDVNIQAIFTTNYVIVIDMI